MMISILTVALIGINCIVGQSTQYEFDMFINTVREVEVLEPIRAAIASQGFRHDQPPAVYSNGFLSVYTTLDVNCGVNNAVSLSVIELGTCQASSNSSYAGSVYILKETSYDTYWSLQETFFQDLYCSVPSHNIPPISNYISKTCTRNFKLPIQPKYWYSLVTYSPAYPGLNRAVPSFEQRYFNNFDSCNAANAVSVGGVAYLLDTCLPSGTSATQFMKLSNCYNSGSEKIKENRGASVVVSKYNNYANCSNGVLATSTTTQRNLNCDASNNFQLAHQKVSSSVCYSSNAETEQLPEGSIYVQSYDGYLSINSFSANATETVEFNGFSQCSSQSFAQQVVHVNHCVPTQNTGVYVKFYDQTVTTITYNLFTDVTCGTPLAVSPNWALSESCKSGGVYHLPCTVTHDDGVCHHSTHWGPLNVTKVSYTITLTKNFPYPKKYDHSLSYKYYLNEDDCLNHISTTLISGVVVPYGGCQNANNMVFLLNSELSVINGQAFEMTGCDGNSYELSMYEANTCSADAVSMVIAQPKFTCVATSQGYLMASCLNFRKNERTIPHDAAYAYLLFFLLVPLFIFIILKIASVKGYLKEPETFPIFVSDAERNDEENINFEQKIEPQAEHEPIHEQEAPTEATSSPPARLQQSTGESKDDENEGKDVGLAVRSPEQI